MKEVNSNLNPKVYVKAIVAAISGAATIVASAVPSDSTVGIVVAAIIAACGTIATWAVPNASKKEA